MALKGCIKKAGKALDAEDRKYMQDLLAKGRPDTEVLNRLEQRIIRERDEAVDLFESQDVPVERADEASEGALSRSQAGQRPAQAVRERATEEGETAVSAEDREGQNGPSGRTEAEASPKPRDASRSSRFDFGPLPESPTQPVSQNVLNLTRESAEAALNILMEGSEIISRYVRGKTGDLMLDAFTNSYMADEDVVAVQGPRTGNTLDLNTPEGLQRQTEILEHEIIHANTVGYIRKTVSEATESPQMRDIKYLSKAVVALRSLDPSKLSQETAYRMQYILSQPDIEVALAEFIAIMGSETDVAQELYKALGRRQGLDRSTLTQTLKRFAERVLKAITGEDLKKELDIELVNAALIRTIENGTEFREQQYQEFRNYTQELGAFNYNNKAPEIAFRRKASFDYLNYAVATMINHRLERKGKTILGNLHAALYDRFPLYTDVADKMVGVYDGSPALQQFVHTVTGEGVNKQIKADVLAKYAAVNAQRTEIINDQLSTINRLSKDLSDKEKLDLDVFISQTPLHDYFIHANTLKTVDEIEAEAELLRKELWKVNARAVRDVEQLIDWNVDENLTGDIYNLDAKEYPMTGEFGAKLRKYYALESIKRVGTKKFVKLLKNEELMDVIRDNSVANALSSIENEGTQQVRDSLIMDYYKEPFQIKTVTQADFRMYEFGEETGWKVLQSPTRTQLGIVYKPTIDSTDIAGVYTDTKLSSTDINVPESQRKMSNVVKSKNGYKLLLTKAQKRELGLIEEFGQGLVRSAAHSIAIQESQIIRDELLKQDTWMEVGNKRSITRLEKIIDSDNVDNPWFLKLSNVEYNQLPQSIRAKYMPVQGRASNVKGFNEEVDLVRKDISHWLLGGSAKSLFQNPQMKWAMRILKDLVAGAKIGMIVLNPIKIANDNLSNLTYLGVLGLDPKFIATNYKDITRDFADYGELQRQVFQLKLQLVARPESTKLKQRLKSLQKRIANNPVGDIADKGFVNSLGSDLVSRSADTLSGFQADMHTALEYLLTKEGKKNYVSHFVMQLQKIGYQAEDFFSYLGDLAGKSKSTKLLQQELDQVAERLQEIKSEEDIVNYVAQFTTSPSSEAVRFGSAMTDLTDVLAKETLYRHFTQNQGMSPEDARIKTLDSFPDYKENMPLSIQQLSDVGILMFPSFWLRIQKIIYRMVRDKPVNLATEMMIQEMVGSDINTIFEANVINKANTFGGLLHMPFEPIGVGSVVPTHAF